MHIFRNPGAFGTKEQNVIGMEVSVKQRSRALAAHQRYSPAFDFCGLGKCLPVGKTLYLDGFGIIHTRPFQRLV